MMKKFIARGMASFLIMVIIVLTMFATTIYATGNDNNYNVDVNIEGTEVNVTFDEKTKILTIENQTSKGIMELQVSISAKETSVKTPSYNLPGLEKLEIDIAQYLSDDLIEENSIDFQIKGYTSFLQLPWYIWILMVVIGVCGAYAIIRLCHLPSMLSELKDL